MASADQVARVKYLREHHHTPSRIARLVGLDLAEVRSVLGLPRAVGPLNDHDLASIRDHAAKGMSLRWIAKNFRISMTTAQRVCADVARPPDAMKQARSLGAKRSQITQARKRRAKARELAARVFLGADVEVPSWVPAELRDLYERVGLYKGEHEAASVIRRLKASGSVACR